MRLIRQNVQRKLEFFDYEKDKGYLDIWSFYQVYALSCVALKENFNIEINYKRINLINKLWRYLNSIPLENSDKIKTINSYFENLINEDRNLIILLLKKTEVKEKEEEIVKKYERGVIGEVVKLR